MLALGTDNSTFSGPSQSDGSALPEGKPPPWTAGLERDSWDLSWWRTTWNLEVNTWHVWGSSQRALLGLSKVRWRVPLMLRWVFGGIRKQHILTKGLIVAASVDQLFEEKKNRLSLLSTRMYFWLAWHSPKVSSTYESRLRVFLDVKVIGNM